MKKLSLFAIAVLGLHLSVNGQINTLTTTNGSVTITPKGLQSKNTNGANAATNIGLGEGALSNTTYANDIIAIGYNANRGINLGNGTSAFSAKNIAIGSSALYSIHPIQAGVVASDGKENIAIGYRSLFSNISGNFNIGIGNLSLVLNTASNNIGVGHYTLASNSVGSENNAFGLSSMADNDKGSLNSAFGGHSLQLNTNGNNNTAIGYRTLYSQAFDNGGTVYNSDNVAVGNFSLYNNNPTAITNGIRNTAVGSNSMYGNVIGKSNTAVGAFALYNNTSSSSNVAIGDGALSSQSFANSNAIYISYNVAVGVDALKATNPTNSSNGFENTAVGGQSMLNNTIGERNVALGASSLRNNTSGSYNTAIGFESLRANISGIENVAIGDLACLLCKGNGNIAIGNEAGYSETGSDKLYIDNSSTSTPLLGGNFSTDVVGINMPIASLASNPTWKLQVGGDINATGAVRAAGVVLTSDKRFKKNIQSIEKPLQKLLQLNGVSYYWRVEEFKDRGFTNKQQIGLIAQEVERVFPDLVDTDAQGYKSVNYVELTPLMIEAIKELKKENEVMKKENELLKSRLDRIEASLQAGVSERSEAGRK